MKCYPFTVLHNFVHDFIRKLMSCFADLISKTVFVIVVLAEDKNCSLANFVLFSIAINWLVEIENLAKTRFLLVFA